MYLYDGNILTGRDKKFAFWQWKVQKNVTEEKISLKIEISTKKKGNFFFQPIFNPIGK